MSLSNISLVNIRAGASRHGHVIEWVATMEVQGDAGEVPSYFSGQRLVESFGPANPVQGFLMASDVRPDRIRDHHGSVSHVVSRLSMGRPGRTFTVQIDGRFDDFHGGSGFVRGELDWFTEAALSRGIKWFFKQTYRHNGRFIAEFKVTRTIDSTRGYTLTKVRTPRTL